MNDLYSRLRENTVIINEEPLSKIDRKQASITRLFPQFDARVKAVGAAGGISLDEEEPGVWRFKATSVTAKPGEKIYDVTMQFSNIESLITKYVADKRLWKSDKSGVDLRKLAAEIYDDVDIKLSCTCPAALYWGFDYIQTKRKTKAGEPETRAPKIRNPKEYGIACKHVQAVIDTLPFYKSTMASHIKRFFMPQVKQAEARVTKVHADLKKGTEFLAKKQAPKPSKVTTPKAVKPEVKKTSSEAPKSKPEAKKKKPEAPKGSI